MKIEVEIMVFVVLRKSGRLTGVAGSLVEYVVDDVNIVICVVCVCNAEDKVTPGTSIPFTPTS
jgi:hypothetical protein